MALFNNITKFLLKPVSILILLALITVSCEKEDIYPASSENIDFILPEYQFVGEQIDLSVSNSDYDNVLWEISNGISFSEPQVTYSFDKPGDYKIVLTVFKNEKPEGTISKNISVLSKGRNYQSDNQFYGLRAFASVNNKILLEGYFTDDSESAVNYLVFDYYFNCIDTLNSQEFINQEFSKSVHIGENTYSFQENNSASQNLFYELKSVSSEAEINSQLSVNANLLNYSGGYIYYYTDINSDFVVEYFDANNSKLWTKRFDGTNATDEKYLFCLNDKLYYVSFDKNSDILYVESFKNVSLTYSKSEYHVGSLPNDREILFAFNNYAHNSISAGIYSKSTNSSFLIDVDAESNINLIKATSGNFNKTIHSCLPDGSIITTDGNKLQKYAGDWNLLNEKLFDTKDFGICKIASNLFFVFENTADGLSLSYIDKHLNNVAL